MDEILYKEILNFEFTFVLYKNKFDEKVVEFPKSANDLKHEENILYILQYAYEEIEAYCTIISSKTDGDNFFEKFKVHSYLSSLNSIDIPISKKVYEILNNIFVLTTSLKNNL